ncbi:S41 family peptidase [Spirosoma pomorum]
MIKLVLSTLFVLSNFLLFAQKPNLDFEQSEANGQPKGWSRIGGNNAYAFVLDSAVKHNGRSALKIAYTTGTGFSGAHISLPVNFAGKNITLTGFVKTQDVGLAPDSFAGLWVRVDNEEGNALAFDNMQSRGIKGTTDWQSYTVTLSIADEARSIHLGGLLVGKGTVWFDDFTILVDDKPIEKAPSKVVKLDKAQLDTTFRKGSGVELTALTKQQINDLSLLGKVWGFVKYYHPSVTEGNHNMDAELFRVMPKLLTATSNAAVNTVILNWLTTFGTIKATRSGQKDTVNAVHKPDYGWFRDLDASVRTQLENIRQAKRSEKSYYIGMMPQVGNPVFQHEAAYSYMKTPDAGYRLLSLYRFWNIIQYFFPYKHLIGEDWNKVLPEFIPKFVNARDSLSYRLAALELIGRIHDTHANVWGDQIIQNQYKGDYYAPVQVRFVEDQFVVSNYYNDSLGTASGLRRGDVIKSLDGVSTEALVQKRLPYYPASNKPTQLRDISRSLLAGHTPTASLEIDRDGQPMTVKLRRYKWGQASFDNKIDYSSYPKDSSYQLLHPDVGYLFLGNIKADKLPQIMQRFNGTKGLVIDFRCYPSDFVVFSLGKYLMPPTPFVKFTAGSTQTPGLFSWSNLLKVGQRGVDNPYKGKVIILVNELTQSSAEYHTMAFRAAPGALVLGSTTAAADGNVSAFVLPGGLSTMISGIGVNYPDGRETQRIGVGVDVDMHPTRKGIQANKDELLEKAVSLIRGGN